MLKHTFDNVKIILQGSYLNLNYNFIFMQMKNEFLNFKRK
jgi:hypothetical protein